jgi:dolichol-phosphate mannosyltransferase
VSSALRSIVVIPTYNERMNILPLAERWKALPEAPDLYFVDDNSPDRTGELLDALHATYPSVRVLHRPRKLGLGSAYRQAFRTLLSESYDRYMTMDADLSHRPESILALLQASTEAEADLVIGSRYIRGGACRGWSLTRHLLSRSANALVRTLLGLRVRDITGGFRCYRRELVEALDRVDVRSNGYAFQIEMAYYTHRLGFRIREEPIVFDQRLHAKSKLSRSEIAQGARTVVRLSIQHHSGQSVPSRETRISNRTLTS